MGKARFVTVDGETLPLGKMLKKHHCNAEKFYRGKRKGLTDEQAIKVPPVSKSAAGRMGKKAGTFGQFCLPGSNPVKT